MFKKVCDNCMNSTHVTADKVRTDKLNIKPGIHCARALFEETYYLVNGVIKLRSGNVHKLKNCYEERDKQATSFNCGQEGRYWKYKRGPKPPE